MINLITLVHKFRRYLMVGAINTGLNFLFMYLGALIGFHYLVYTSIGYLVTIFLSFFMNLHYTFKVRDKQLLRLIGFFGVSLLNLGIVECLEYLLVEKCHLSLMFAIPMAMCWYVLVGFSVSNYVIYRDFSFQRDRT